ncbi:hypothetical protein [Tenacibaculum ovolyticum]|uniref:hypothetical protein n=1 Tax=Tenacibaculum ovolyticum TaxID=104270 RepID=UPI000AC1D156|nr:hypothetical protein [Tenacibaculum ovolyticum]
MIREFLRKWLGIHKNEVNIDYNEEQIEELESSLTINNKRIVGNQKQITSIKNKIKKH